MATALNQLGVGIVDYKVISSLYSKTFDDVVKVNMEIPREGAEFMGQRTTNLETYKEGQAFRSVIAPPKNEDTDRVPLITPLEGYNQTWTNYIRRLGFLLTRSAITRQKSKQISQLINGLPDCAKVCEEMAYADMFNKGFATNTGGDSGYIFSTSHYLEDAQYGTWDNAPSVAVAFTTDSFFAAWKNLMKRTDPKGNPTPMKPAKVYYPVDIQEAVSKVHNSSQYPQNSLNAKLDPLFSAWEMRPGVWLTSTTAWFVQAQVNEADKGLVIVWEDKPNYADISDSMNPDIVLGKRLRMSFSTGCILARDWYATAGA